MSYWTRLPANEPGLVTRFRAAIPKLLGGFSVAVVALMIK